MPYAIKKRGGKKCVTHAGKTFGCHASLEKAKRQIAAIYANSKEGKKAKK